MNRSTLPFGRSSWLTGGRFAARKRVWRQFDLQYLQAMQIKKKDARIAYFEKNRNRK